MLELVDLERVLVAAEGRYFGNKYHTDSLMRLSPLDRLPKTHSSYVAFAKRHDVHPVKRHTHSLYRTDRFSRLKDGTYTVRLPREERTHREGTLVLPAVSVDVEHTRVTHPRAKFDQKRWLQEDDRTAVEIASDPSKIRRLVNLELVAREVASVYSEFRMQVPLPKGWEKIQTAFESFYKRHMAPYEDSRTDKENIRENDTAFMHEHRSIMGDFDRVVTVAREQEKRVLYHLFDTYYALIHGCLYHTKFELPTQLSLDPKQREVSHLNVEPFRRDLVWTDYSAGSAVTWKLPFNTRFHDEFREYLVQKRAKEPWEHDAIEALRDAYKLLDVNPGMAHVQGSAAFETFLRHFSYENRATQSVDERHSMRNMLEKIFPKAVGATFDKHIANKLLHMRSDLPEMAPVHWLRNQAAHKVNFVPPGSRAYESASLACRVYTEAMMYLMREEWGCNAIPRASDLVIWTNQRAHLGETPRSFTKRLVYRTLDRAKNYLDPREQHVLNRTPLPRGLA
ncbi:MAG: hypothetical protein OXR66_07790 [Candidatus Woesearchaeota archaeon]|nr:hypothetical protein [Candidatus Woesearchaeota archaeon]